MPPEGRPAAFLGGVGDFSVEADVSPATVRVGQELTYRITVTGPAAWGMTARPDLSRLERLAIAPRIEALPDETIHEPPSRTFVTRLRPTRPGDAVLPPVVIAAFDPETLRYFSKATKGLAVKAVAVPAFDPRSLDYAPPDTSRERRMQRRMDPRRGDLGDHDWALGPGPRRSKTLAHDHDRRPQGGEAIRPADEATPEPQR